MYVRVKWSLLIYSAEDNPCFWRLFYSIPKVGNQVDCVLLVHTAAPLLVAVLMLQSSPLPVAYDVFSFYCSFEWFLIISAPLRCLVWIMIGSVHCLHFNRINAWTCTFISSWEWHVNHVGCVVIRVDFLFRWIHRFGRFAREAPTSSAAESWAHHRSDILIQLNEWHIFRVNFTRNSSCISNSIYSVSIKLTTKTLARNISVPNRQ